MKSNSEYHRSIQVRAARQQRDTATRRRRLFAFLLFTFYFCLAQAPQARAQNWETSGPPKQERAANSKPKLLENVGIDQRLEQQVPLDLTFRDESGNSVRLGDYFGQKPVVLSLVYYSC